MRFDRDTYFRGHREIFGKLRQEQVNGLSFLLDSIELDEWENVQQVSYVLATVDHETNHSFQPVKEIRERKDSPRRANQDRYWLDGYYGRGYVQITWKKNYEKFGIENDPDAALEPEMAYRILSKGMRDGLFTGKKIGDYINEQRADYVNARRVVNGLDRAQQIAANARKFEAILTTAAAQDVQPEVSTPPPPIVDTKPVQAPVESAPTVPPTVQVPTPKGSITSKIAAATAAVTPILTATGLKIGGIQFSGVGVIALCFLIAVGVVVAGVLWDRDRQRQFERQKLSIQNLASPTLNNVVAKSE